MADQIRKLDTPMVQQAIAVQNKSRLDAMKLKAGLIFHADASTPASTVTATDLPSTLTLANSIATLYGSHIGSACDPTSGQGAHIAADTTNTITATTPATDQTSVDTLLNDIKAKFNLHIAVSADHAAADTVNTIAAAAATNLATSITLVNAIAVGLNAHFAAAMNGQATNLIGP